MQTEQNGISRRNSTTTRTTTNSIHINQSPTRINVKPDTAAVITIENVNSSANNTDNSTDTASAAAAATADQAVEPGVNGEMKGEKENWDIDGIDDLQIRDPDGNRDGKGVWKGGKSLRFSQQAEDQSSAQSRDKEDGKHAINPLGLHLVSHSERGRGVFTEKEIKAGTLIEESPVLVLSRDEWEGMEKSILGSYGFCWSGGGMGLGLGLGEYTN